MQKEPSWLDIRKKSRALRHKVESLSREIKSIAARDPIDAIDACAVLGAEIKAWEATILPIWSHGRELIAALEEVKKEQSETFDQRLVLALKSRSYHVFGESGQFIVEGIIHIEINAATARVVVNDDILPDFSVDSVVAKVDEKLRQLQKEVTSPERVLEGIHVAYEREIRATGRQPGSQVDIAAILMQLVLLRQTPRFRSNPRSSNFRQYPLDLFRAELYTLLLSGKIVIQGKCLRCASGADTKGAVFMLLPSLARPAYIGRISFEDVRL